MERFCPKCGSLVEGTGMFCPSCGEKLESAVSLDKPASVDVMPGTQPMNSSPSFNNQQSGTSTTYANQNNTASAMPNYPQSYNAVNTTPAGEMTVGQWVLTIFLSGLGIIGIILLFVWAFGSETCVAKKNYARAMLIWQAVALALSILYIISMFACGLGFMSEIFQELEHAQYTSLAATLSTMF